MAGSYYNLGLICEAEESIEFLNKAANIWWQLYELFPDVQCYAEWYAGVQKVLSVRYDDLGRSCQEQGCLDDAKVYYEKVLTIREYLAGKLGTAQSYDDMAVNYYNLGLLYEAEKSIEFLSKAEKLWQQLHESFPNDAHYGQRLEVVTNALAELEGNLQ